jgi:hypothetical protein
VNGEAVHFLRPEPFPTEATRDLLGLVRAMWRAELDQARRDALAAVGKDLAWSLEIVATMPFANTPQQASAWAIAERATQALGALVADGEGAFKPVLEAAAARVVGSKA